jgi:chromosome segregation ATPase
MTTEPLIPLRDALDGIAQLERRIAQVVELQQIAQTQITQLSGAISQVRNQVFEGDSTVLSMADARIATHRAALDVQVGSHEQRLAALETGAHAAILARLDEDRAERKERRAEEQAERAARRQETDRRTSRIFWALAAVAVALIIVAAMIYLRIR